MPTDGIADCSRKEAGDTRTSTSHASLAARQTALAEVKGCQLLAVTLDAIHTQQGSAHWPLED